MTHVKLFAGWLALVVIVLAPARALPFGDDITTSTECGCGSLAVVVRGRGDARAEMAPL
jgi:hypothetical protein